MSRRGGAVGPAPSEGSRPLRADARKNRDRLLSSARVLFAERGLDTSLDEIAAHAGLGIATAYRRFAHKGELIDALFEQRMDAVVEFARTCAEDPVAWDGLVRFLEQTCAAMIADRGLRDMLMRTESVKGKSSRIRQRLLPIMEDLVARAHAAGDLRPDFSARDLPMVVLMIEAVVDATGGIDPQLYHRYLALILVGLRRAGDPPVLPGEPLTAEQTEQAFARRHARH